MTIEEYIEKLEKHDWWYMMADDHRAYKSGEAAHKKLKELANTNEEFQKEYCRMEAKKYASNIKFDD